LLIKVKRFPASTLSLPPAPLQRQTRKYTSHEDSSTNNLPDHTPLHRT